MLNVLRYSVDVCGLRGSKKKDNTEQARKEEQQQEKNEPQSPTEARDVSPSNDHSKSCRLIVLPVNWELSDPLSSSVMAEGSCKMLTGRSTVN